MKDGKVEMGIILKKADIEIGWIFEQNCYSVWYLK